MFLSFLFTFVLFFPITLCEDQWTLYFPGNDPNCHGEPYFQTRDSIAACVEKPCANGKEIRCSGQDTLGRCRIKQWVNTTQIGEVCAAGHAVSDFYGKTRFCHFRGAANYCMFEHDSVSYTHFVYSCFDDASCSTNRRVLQDFVHEKCSRDTLVDEMFSIFTGQCDDWSDAWTFSYSQKDCTGTPTRIERSNNPGTCQPVSCTEEGKYGPYTVQCEAPALTGLCHTQFFDNTLDGNRCNPKAVKGDVFAAPNECLDFSYLLGDQVWCIYEHLVGHLVLKCYSHSSCTGASETIVNTFSDGECVIDHWGVANKFTSAGGCDDVGSESAQWVIYAFDDKCDDLFWTRKERMFKSCVETECHKDLSHDSMFTEIRCDDEVEEDFRKRLCQLKNFDGNTTLGEKCDDSMYTADSYVFPDECVDFSDSGLGYCLYEEGKGGDEGYLFFKCYSGKDCAKNEQVVAEYMKGACVPHLGSSLDSSMFVRCYTPGWKKEIVYKLFPGGVITFCVLWLFSIGLSVGLAIALVVVCTKLKSRKFEPKKIEMGKQIQTSDLGNYQSF